MNGNLFAPDDDDATSELFTAHCDGGSRGNPGPAGFGALIEGADGRTVARLSEFLGIQTNNYAEYSGMIAVLRWAIENGARRVAVVSDSELMVKQMQGKYKVSSPAIKPLWEEGRKLVRQLDGFEIRHTLRAGNKEADRLANEAMDRGMGKTTSPQATSGPASQPAGGSALRAPAARPYGKLETTGPAQVRPATPDQPKKQILEGYVKNGVVHLLEGELPEGVFVKIVRE
ncbi:ribonuclease HI family protein [Telmatobacter bradus]|uniref:ribonuclease HI family protein n=1 Tax=Telmatobacter bradus TaxID=474953 RepID=UPI003B429B9D